MHASAVGGVVVVVVMVAALVVGWAMLETPFKPAPQCTPCDALDASAYMTVGTSFLEVLQQAKKEHACVFSPPSVLAATPCVVCRLPMANRWMSPRLGEL